MTVNAISVSPMWPWIAVPIDARNSARNQWKARLPAVMVQRSTRNFLPVRRRMVIHADSGSGMCSLNRAGVGRGAMAQYRSADGCFRMQVAEILLVQAATGRRSVWRPGPCPGSSPFQDDQCRPRSQLIPACWGTDEHDGAVPQLP